ncbi:hypothetical protein [Acidisphaera sp. S103]|uniref:hypothetical protein n=1 Tax=Acidisphaera sp. S103 TaxID=1747223 RepID=UPI00131A9B9F|nr:hypothetical protein [Acidisphaera sp. S103]
MPETPSDSFDRLGEAGTSLAISLRGVGPTCGRLGDVLNPHRDVEPIQYMVSRTGAGGFAERSWTIGTIAQDGDRYRWRGSQSMKHTAQLSRLRRRLRRHAREYDLFPLIVAEFSERTADWKAKAVQTRCYAVRENQDQPCHNRGVDVHIDQIRPQGLTKILE